MTRDNVDQLLLNGSEPQAWARPLAGITEFVPGSGKRPSRALAVGLAEARASLAVNYRGRQRAQRERQRCLAWRYHGRGLARLWDQRQSQTPDRKHYSRLWAPRHTCQQCCQDYWAGAPRRCRMENQGFALE